jgi:hypothetical protein
MRVEARGTIYDTTRRPEHEKIAFFPSLCLTANGLLFSGCQVGAIKQSPTSTIRINRSEDGGNTWSELPFRFETSYQGVPGSLVTAEMFEPEPGRLMLFASWFDRTDPNRPLFDPVTQAIVHVKLLRAESTDNGNTWSAWQALPFPPPLTGCSSCGPILQWKDGTIGFPFESYREIGDVNPAPHAAWILVSRDGGRAFPQLVDVAVDPEHKIYYWDERLCLGRQNGEYVALFWTHNLELKQDMTVHLRWGMLGDTRPSHTAIKATTIRGQIAAPLLLEDGRLLAFVVDRVKPATMKLWVSRDRGATWPEKDALVVYNHEEKAAVTQGTNNIDYNQYWEDMGKWSFGHPGIKLLAKGKVLVTYYSGTPDRMSVRWARIAV